MKIVTDHSTWCDECGEYLSTDNPGVNLFAKVLWPEKGGQHVVCIMSAEVGNDDSR